VQEGVDLGIVIQEDLKWAKQCAKVVAKQQNIRLGKKMFWTFNGGYVSQAE
jgi:hypothetical protein